MARERLRLKESNYEKVILIICALLTLKRGKLILF